MSSELLTSLSPQEMPSRLLVIHGKNVGIGSTPADIQRNRRHLSVESRMSAIAAGMLYASGTTLLFSTGKTAGPDVPAEAATMAACTKSYFPDIPEEDIVIEDRSIDTAGNAEEVAKDLAASGRHYDTIELVSIGGHVDNAATLFKRKGVPIDRTYASEDVLRNRSSHHARYVARWKREPRVVMERIKERARWLLLHSIDPQGDLIGRVTSRSRTF